MCSPAYGTFRHGMSPGLREDKTKSFMYAHKPDCNGRFMRFFIRIKISGGDYMKKRILALLLVIAMAVLMLSACGNKEQETTTTETTVATREIRKITADNVPEGKVLLSSLDSEALRSFLAYKGVTLSDDVPDAELHSFILVVESDIDFERYLDPLRWSTLNNQPAKNIHKVVKEYYGY